MRQIIWIGILVFLAITNYSLAVADVTREENGDVVVYKQVEAQRYKGVPQEVPLERAVEILQAGKGEYVLRTHEDTWYTFAFPAIRTSVTTKTVIRYQNGKWMPVVSFSEPPETTLTCLPIIALGLLVGAFFYVALANLKTYSGDRRLIFPYAVIVASFAVGHVAQLTMYTSHSGNGLGGLSTIVVVLGAFAGSFACRESGSDWRLGSIVLTAAAVLLGLITGHTIHSWPFDTGFVDAALAFLMWGCAAAYIVARVISWSFPILDRRPTNHS